MAPKPNYEKPTQQVDLEERLKDDYVPAAVLTVAEDPVVTSENGYVAVDPIYQNFANETDKPFAAEKGPEKKLEEGAVSGTPLYNDETDFDAGATADGEGEEDPEETAETGQSAGGTTPTSQTPPSGQNPPS